MRRYEQYKPSGLDWLADVPSHWQVVANRALFRERQEAGEDGLPVLSVSLHTGVSDDEQDEEENARTKTRMADRTSYKRVRPGDVAYNMMRAWQGAIGAVRTDGLVSPAYVVAAPTDALNPAYFEYLYRTDWLIGEMNRASKGITDFRKRLYWQEFKQLLTLVPPREEQDRIVAFIDKKASDIEASIAKKRRLIDLLQEQKTILINQAVTFGVSNHKDMQGCDIPGFGSIPAGWNIRKLKHVCAYQEGPGIMAADFREEGVPLIRIAGVKGHRVTLEGCNFLSRQKVSRRWAHFRLNRGDLLISGSASSGTVAEVVDEGIGAIAYTGLFRITLLQSQITKQFAKLYFSAAAFNDQMNVFKTGVGLQHFGPSHLARAWIALPSLGEQEKITGFVEERVLCIEDTIAATKLVIEKLIEAKLNLIAAVVTGRVGF